MNETFETEVTEVEETTMAVDNSWDSDFVSDTDIVATESTEEGKKKVDASGTVILVMAALGAVTAVGAAAKGFKKLGAVIKKKKMAVDKEKMTKEREEAKDVEFEEVTEDETEE